MKKTFWGYDVREADEVIDSLRSQNSILSSKLTKLNMELAAKSEMETPAPAAAAAVLPVVTSRSTGTKEEAMRSGSPKEEKTSFKKEDMPL